MSRIIIGSPSCRKVSRLEVEGGGRGEEVGRRRGRERGERKRMKKRIEGGRGDRTKEGGLRD